MPTETASLEDGAQWFATDAAGAEEIAKRRWPEGCRGSHGGHEQGWYHAPRCRTESDGLRGWCGWIRSAWRSSGSCATPGPLACEPIWRSLAGSMSGRCKAGGSGSAATRGIGP